MAYVSYVSYVSYVWVREGDGGGEKGEEGNHFLLGLFGGESSAFKTLHILYEIFMKWFANFCDLENFL